MWIRSGPRSRPSRAGIRSDKFGFTSPVQRPPHTLLRIRSQREHYVNHANRSRAHAGRRDRAAKSDQATRPSSTGGVWLVGFILAGLTFLDGMRLAVLPPASNGHPREGEKGFVIQVAGSSPALETAVENSSKGAEAFPLRIFPEQELRVVYFAVILVVIFGANVPLRGVASLLAILGLLVMVVVISILDGWGPILDFPRRPPN